VLVHPGENRIMKELFRKRLVIIMMEMAIFPENTGLGYYCRLVINASKQLPLPEAKPY